MQIQFCNVPNLPDDTLVSPEHAHGYRSILTSMLFQCQCNVDIMTEVTQLQGFNNEPRVTHLKRANALLKKAQADRTNLGLHFPRLRPPFCLRAIGDANHTTKTSVYPQEGQFVFLMEDRPLTMQGNILTKEAIKNLSGRCHPLAIGSQKARKVAHSTSMGETNCGLSVVSNAQMVAMRLTEMHVILRGSVSQRIAVLIDMNERGQYIIPVDHLTDCKDLYELVTGLKGIPQDKQQRLPVMALREERLAGRIRWTGHIPTDVMVADGLTKPGTFPQLMKLLTTGIVDLTTNKKEITFKRLLFILAGYSESDLETIQKFE